MLCELPLAPRNACGFCWWPFALSLSCILVDFPGPNEIVCIYLLFTILLRTHMSRSLTTSGLALQAGRCPFIVLFVPRARYIPLPTGMHKEWSIKTAAKGKHVLCEKPVGTSADDVKEIIAACAANGVQFMDGASPVPQLPRLMI